MSSWNPLTRQGGIFNHDSGKIKVLIGISGGRILSAWAFIFNFSLIDSLAACGSSLLPFDDAYLEVVYNLEVFLL